MTEDAKIEAIISLHEHNIATDKRIAELEAGVGAAKAALRGYQKDPWMLGEQHDAEVRRKAFEECAAIAEHYDIPDSGVGITLAVEAIRSEGEK